MHPLRLKLEGYYRRVANYVRLATLPRTSHAPVNSQMIAARPELADVSAHHDRLDLGALNVLANAPVWMTGAERLALYTLIYTTRPNRYLEIGTFYGGSALIVCAAMDALAFDGTYDGRMICLDPAHQVAAEHRQKIEHRATLLEGFSPAALPEAQRRVGGLFDFVLIDGDHSYASVLSDFNGVMAHLAPDAYVLCHDAFHPDVGRALSDGYQRNISSLVDCGYITRETTQNDPTANAGTTWCGLRLFRFCPKKAQD